jgi:glycosyltransferase involved in cell wall biosynthesis
MEALAVGTPVVATNVGGIPDQIQPMVNGLLVEPGDSVALAEALDKAFVTQWSADVVRQSSAPFWWSSISARLGEIYREVAEAPAF